MSLLLLVVGIVLLLGALIVLNWFVGMAPHDLARAIRTFGATIAGLAGTGLLIAGRWGLALIALVALVAALRSLRQGSGAASMGDSDSTQTSQVETDTLRMTLNHATGELDGEVVAGPHQGRTLASLGLSDLLQLLLHCRIEDPGSVALLETYLDRREPRWRDQGWSEQEAHAGAGAGGGSGGGGGDRGRGGYDAGGGTGVMDEARALDVLGLSPGADEDEIKAAHRRLMSRLHPDAGGSNYLAAEINRAKDFLLRRRR